MWLIRCGFVKDFGLDWCLMSRFNTISRSLYNIAWEKPCRLVKPQVAPDSYRLLIEWSAQDSNPFLVIRAVSWVNWKPRFVSIGTIFQSQQSRMSCSYLWVLAGISVLWILSDASFARPHLSADRTSWRPPTWRNMKEMSYCISGFYTSMY